MGFEKLVISKMLVKGACRRLLTVDNHCGMALSGLLADGRQVRIHVLAHVFFIEKLATSQDFGRRD